MSHLRCRTAGLARSGRSSRDGKYEMILVGGFNSWTGYVWLGYIPNGHGRQIIAGWWLTYPSEKYESQWGWDYPIYYGK